MTREAVLKEIIKNVYDILPELEGKKITQKDSLREIGANSIDRADIIMSTLETFKIKIQMVKFGNAKNIGDIIDVITGG